MAKATSSGVFFMKAAIISTRAAKLHGSLRWNVQYLFVRAEEEEIVFFLEKKEKDNNNLCK